MGPFDALRKSGVLSSGHGEVSQINGEPKWSDEAKRERVERARGLSKLPYNPYAGPRIAPLTDEHLQSYKLVEDELRRRGSDDTYDTVRREIDAASKMKGHDQARNYIKASVSDPTRLHDKFTNKYQNEVLTAMNEEAARDFIESLPGLERTAIGRGAFASGAYDKVKAKIAADVTSKLMKDRALFKSQSYQNAIDQTNRLQERHLTAGQLAAGVVGSDRAALMESAKRRAGLDRERMGTTVAASAAMQEIANQRQNQKQKEFDTAKLVHEERENNPWIQLQRETAIHQGSAPVGLETLTSASTPVVPRANPYTVASGALNKLAETIIPGHKSGGKVRKFSSGGALEPSYANNPFQVVEETRNIGDSDLYGPEMKAMHEIAVNQSRNQRNPDKAYFNSMASGLFKGAHDLPFVALGNAMESAQSAKSATLTENEESKIKAFNLLKLMRESKIAQDKFIADNKFKAIDLGQKIRHQNEIERHNKAHEDLLRSQINSKESQLLNKGKKFLYNEEGKPYAVRTADDNKYIHGIIDAVTQNDRAVQKLLKFHNQAKKINTNRLVDALYNPNKSWSGVLTNAIAGILSGNQSALERADSLSTDYAQEQAAANTKGTNYQLQTKRASKVGIGNTRETIDIGVAEQIAGHQEFANDAMEKARAAGASPEEMAIIREKLDTYNLPEIRSIFEKANNYEKSSQKRKKQLNTKKVVNSVKDVLSGYVNPSENEVFEPSEKKKSNLGDVSYKEGGHVENKFSSGGNLEESSDESSEESSTEDDDNYDYSRYLKTGVRGAAGGLGSILDILALGHNVPRFIYDRSLKNWVSPSSYIKKSFPKDWEPKNTSERYVDTISDFAGSVISGGPIKAVVSSLVPLTKKIAPLASKSPEFVKKVGKAIYGGLTDNSKRALATSVGTGAAFQTLDELGDDGKLKLALTLASPGWAKTKNFFADKRSEAALGKTYIQDAIADAQGKKVFGNSLDVTEKSLGQDVQNIVNAYAKKNQRKFDQMYNESVNPALHETSPIDVSKALEKHSDFFSRQINKVDIDNYLKSVDGKNLSFLLHSKAKNYDSLQKEILSSMVQKELSSGKSIAEIDPSEMINSNKALSSFVLPKDLDKFINKFNKNKESVAKEHKKLLAMGFNTDNYQNLFFNSYSKYPTNISTLHRPENVLTKVRDYASEGNHHLLPTAEKQVYLQNENILKNKVLYPELERLNDDASRKLRNATNENFFWQKRKSFVDELANKKMVPEKTIQKMVSELKDGAYNLKFVKGIAGDKASEIADNFRKVIALDGSQYDITKLYKTYNKLPDDAKRIFTLGMTKDTRKQMLEGFDVLEKIENLKKKSFSYENNPIKTTMDVPGLSLYSKLIKSLGRKTLFREFDKNPEKLIPYLLGERKNKDILAKTLRKKGRSRFVALNRERNVPNINDLDDSDE